MPFQAHPKHIPNQVWLFPSEYIKETMLLHPKTLHNMLCDTFLFKTMLSELLDSTTFLSINQGVSDMKPPNLWPCYRGAGWGTTPEQVSNQEPHSWRCYYSIWGLVYCTQKQQQSLWFYYGINLFYSLLYTGALNSYWVYVYHLQHIMHNIIIQHVLYHKFPYHRTSWS